jgi:hypothetical protein
MTGFEEGGRLAFSGEMASAKRFLAADYSGVNDTGRNQAGKISDIFPLA